LNKIIKSGKECFYYWIWCRTFSRNCMQSFKKIYVWEKRCVSGVSYLNCVTYCKCNNMESL